MKRKKAIQPSKDLPIKFGFNELTERLIFMNKVQKGLEQANKGEVVPHSKVIGSFKTKWA